MRLQYPIDLVQKTFSAFKVKIKEEICLKMTIYGQSLKLLLEMHQQLNSCLVSESKNL